MLDPIVRTIEVPCGQAQAFHIFVSEMGSWWPLERFSASLVRGQSASALRVEPHAGGQIMEIAEDGTEHHWGTFTIYEPHDVIQMDFHIAEPATAASQVEVRFTAQGSDRTRVVLTQSNWEAFGDKAEMMRGGYGTGWRAIFEEAYLKACGG